MDVKLLKLQFCKYRSKFCALDVDSNNLNFGSISINFAFDMKRI